MRPLLNYKKASPRARGNKKERVIMKRTRKIKAEKTEVRPRHPAAGAGNPRYVFYRPRCRYILIFSGFCDILLEKNVHQLERLMHLPYKERCIE